MIAQQMIAQDKIEKINDTIVIHGEDDWQKVQIVNLDFDVSDLEKGEEIKAFEYGGINKTIESKILQKIKRIAASKGYHTVVLSSKNITRRTVYSDKNGRRFKSSITGVGYTY
ncbi:MAG: hypothetical protein COA77_00005 [Thaumarchaeota archaeon]|nr:MAG: hypothetical protein COA77_00005 [Nitrososphaerota archaeon]